VSRLHNIIVSSLDFGSSVLIVATPEHRRQLDSALRDSSPATRKAMKRRLLMLDAQETLNMFMVNRHPSDQRFSQTVGKLIKELKQSAKNEQRGLTVFGEMVEILWSEGNKLGALELERMWNDALQDRSFHLHCAYPRSILRDSVGAVTLKAICDEHSSVIGHANHLRRSVA